jgi:hypothetical protein
MNLSQHQLQPDQCLILRSTSNPKPRQYTIPSWHYKQLNRGTFLFKPFTKVDTDPRVIKQTAL